VGEVALAVIMLVGASLFVQSFQRLLVADGSFDTTSILTMVADLEQDVAEPADVVTRRVGDLVEHLARQPDMTGVAAATFTPLRDAGVRTAVIADTFTGRDDEAPSVLLGGVTAAFFDVLDVPIQQGRAFTDTEGRSLSAVAIVNHALDERFWPGESAVGRRFRRAGDTGATWFTVVGVSNDILSWDVSNRPLPTAYLPYAYLPAREPRVLLRTSGEPSRLATTIRATVHAADASITVIDVQTMTGLHYLALSRNQTLALLFTALGVIALVLGATGVYGVLSYFVSERTYEIGVRAALGADRRMLIGLFMRQGMALVLTGIVLGGVGAWAMARVVRGQLHGVSATDPLSFGGVAMLMLAVGLAATYVPARRAAQVDPMSALRD
jgi:predicted permease